MAGFETARHVAAILNAAYMVRYYSRGARLALHREHRALAIEHLGLVVRAAFNASEDFEPLLTALVDGLSPREPRF